MKFQGFRLPDGIIRDMNYIAHESGMSKSMIVRNGLQLVINDYFAKEKIKIEIEQMEKNKMNKTAHKGEYFTFPDGW